MSALYEFDPDNQPRARRSLKDWFYDHPNVTFVLLGLWYLWLVWVTVAFFGDERWGWAAAGAVVSVVAAGDARRWWRDHL